MLEAIPVSGNEVELDHDCFEVQVNFSNHIFLLIQLHLLDLYQNFLIFIVKSTQ